MAEKIKKEAVKNKKINRKDNKKKEVRKTKDSYIKQTRKELKLVKWPTFKEVLKYTVSTIVFCIVLCLFFLLLNLIMSYVKGLFV